MAEPRTALAQLFRTAGQAHHKAFAATNGDDPEWAEWYARYLAVPISELLGTTLSPEALGAALRNIDRQMRSVAPSAEWTVYYADWFLARYPPTRGQARSSN